MARIKKVQKLVHNALVDNPVTRTDDFLLVLEVLRNFVTTEMSLETVLEHHIELGVPSFESISRARRKLQAKYPELVNETAAQIRAQEEKEFRAYAVNS